MRLAYVCADPGVPVFGRKGCSIHVREVLRELVAQGVDVRLFARGCEDPPPPELAHVPVSRLASLRQGDVAARERSALESNALLWVELERWGPFDALYERYSLWSFAGMEYAREAGIPGLLEVNSPLVEEELRYRKLSNPAGARATAARAFGAASGLLAVSEGVAGYLEKLGVGRDRIHVVPNGVDARRFSEPLAPTLNRDAGGFTVGFVGSLRPWHGLSLLVEAFARLHESHPRCRLLVVGGGPGQPELESDLSARGLLGAARLTGPVPPEEVPGLLASMDVAVAPYPALEGFYFSPLKVYEYMAAGLPVVASRIGQLAELIVDGQDGLLCAPGDVSGLAAALERLRREPALRQRLGRAARSKVSREHSWAGVVQRILILAAGGPSRGAGRRAGEAG